MKLGLLSALLLCSAGCLHAKRVETARAVEEPAKPKAKSKPKPVSPPKTTASAEAPQKVVPPARPVAPEPGRPMLGNTPKALMRPSGPLLIQKSLASRGYLDANGLSGELDERTSAALRVFQGDQRLPRTGAPDRETVRRLGVDPDDVFLGDLAVLGG